jgi:hypothetical protein
MSTPLLLDVAIRDWVFLPLFVFVFFFMALRDAAQKTFQTKGNDTDLETFQRVYVRSC